MWIGIANLIFELLLELGYNAGRVLPNLEVLYLIIMKLISLEENSKKLDLDMPAPLSFFINMLREVFVTKGGNFK